MLMLILQPWTTNQPNAYLDTTFGDSNNEKSFCVGVDNTSGLVSGSWYNWSITGLKGSKPGYPNDGRFKVTAQRGYNYGTSGAYGVFAEEHEKILRLGLSSNQNWVPVSKNAWTLASNGTTWTFRADTGTVS